MKAAKTKTFTQEQRDALAKVIETQGQFWDAMTELESVLGASLVLGISLDGTSDYTVLQANDVSLAFVMEEYQE